jgi:hypothetical protein
MNGTAVAAIPTAIRTTISVAPHRRHRCPRDCPRDCPRAPIALPARRPVRSPRHGPAAQRHRMRCRRHPRRGPGPKGATWRPDRQRKSRLRFRDRATAGPHSGRFSGRLSGRAGWRGSNSLRRGESGRVGQRVIAHRNVRITFLKCLPLISCWWYPYEACAMMYHHDTSPTS